MRRIKLYPPQNNAYVILDIQVSSSTLFGALANNYTLLHGADRFPEFLQHFNEGLRISCLFPALQVEEKEIFFLPKPYLSYHSSEIDANEEGLDKKALKKLRWFSLGLLARIKNNIQQKDEEVFHTLNLQDSEILIIGGQFALLKSELEMEDIPGNLEDMKLFNQSESPRVAVPRFGGDADPFHQIEITVPVVQNAGKTWQLFFYYLEQKSPDNTEWRATRELMAEEGIGGKRSLGKGWFEKIVVEEMNFPATTGIQMLLSDIIPQKTELPKIFSYDLRRDDGFITFGKATSFKKSPLYMVKAGAVLKGKIEGRMVGDKTPNNTFYRYGIAMSYPLNGE